MIVPDQVRKCVVFIGLKMGDGTFQMVGSGFLLAAPPGGVEAAFLISARHVIDAIRDKGLREVQLRVNLKEGGAVWIATEIDDWFSHPEDKSIDVAIVRIRIGTDVDHLIVPYDLCATEEKMKANEVGLGDEVFITGLFRHHHGTRRNIPIVRVGNVACLNEEKITTSKYGPIDAYLIESRSIGGLSGSPVFLNLGVVRRLAGTMKFAQEGQVLLLFGLIHGHFENKMKDLDHQSDNDLTPERINTGIAMVVPFQRIVEVMNLYATSRQAG